MTLWTVVVKNSHTLKLKLNCNLLYRWLSSSNNNNNNNFLTAIQDQVALTRNYKKYILKQPDTDEVCRRCGKESETIQHITAACDQLAPTEYVKSHDGLAKIIHQKLAEAAELIGDKSPYYKYTKQYLLIDLI